MSVVIEPVIYSVVVQEADGATTTVQQDPTYLVEVTEGSVGLPGPTGPQGPPGDSIVGPEGPAGPQGEPGIPFYSYVHTQSSPSATWTIEHNLGGLLNITVIDSAGSQIEGDVVFQDLNTVVIQYSGAFSGTAFLS